MSRYQQSSSNPFEDDEEDSDFVLVNKARSSSRPTTNNMSSGSSHSLKSNSSIDRNQRYGNQSQRSANQYASQHTSPYSYDDESSPFDDRREKVMKMIDVSENNQIESTQRALASIYDSEAMGVATAEELVRQGETLDNIENKTESMQQNLKTSQRHLNNIKSVFGGIKNWWSGDKAAQQSKKQQEDNANARLRATIEKTEIKKPDTSGFYDDDDDLDSKFMAGARKPGSVGGGYTMISPVTRSAREEEIDSNLFMMSEGMSRLKGLAIGLGDEIGRQNEQLDRINVKVDQTDVLLGHQNTQMRKILKK